MNPTLHSLTLSEPATYRICVVGRLPKDWVQQFGPMNITEQRSPGGALFTVFVAPVPDQAGLHGLLNQLRDLGLPLVLLELLRADAPA